MTHENKQPKSKKPNYNQQPRRFQNKPVLTTPNTLHKECRLCSYKHENKKKNVQHWAQGPKTFQVKMQESQCELRFSTR